jgi:hypothetical protein
VQLQGLCTGSSRERDEADRELRGVAGFESDSSPWRQPPVMVEFLAGLVILLIGFAIGFVVGVISNKAEEEDE